MKVNVYCELSDAQKNDPENGYVIDQFFDDIPYAVQVAAEKFYDDSDGSEWMWDGCTLYSVDPGGVIRSHAVTMDWSPDFYVPEGEVVK